MTIAPQHILRVNRVSRSKLLVGGRWPVAQPCGDVTVAIASIIGGIVVMYGFGIVGMSIALDKTLAECALLVTAFIPGDVIKAVLTGLIVQALARSRPDALLSRG